MRVMAFASQKGGSGKTTLAGHIAVQAESVGAGPVAIIDTDPQGSLSDWWNARRAQTPVFAQTFISRVVEGERRAPNGNESGCDSNTDRGTESTNGRLRTR